MIVDNLLSFPLGSNLLICAEFSLAALNSYDGKNLRVSIAIDRGERTFNNRR